MTLTCSTVWRTAVPSAHGWGATLDRPAVCIDRDQGHLYVHGGRLTIGGRFSSTLLQMDIKQLADLSGTVGAPPDSKFSSLIKVLDEPSGERSPGPMLHDHVMFSCGTYLVLHGGYDGTDVCNRVYSYYLESSVWDDMQSTFGGCDVPRMRGHCAAQISKADARFVICGAVSRPDGRRAKKAARNSRRDSMAQAADGELYVMSVYTVCMQDRQEGWRRVQTTGTCPGPRKNFSMEALPPNPTGEAKEVVLAGGLTGKTEHTDIWVLALAAGTWREVRLLPHPGRGWETFGQPIAKKVLYLTVVHSCFYKKGAAVKGDGAAAKDGMKDNGSDAVKDSGVTVYCAPRRAQPPTGNLPATITLRAGIDAPVTAVPQNITSNSVLKVLLWFSIGEHQFRLHSDGKVDFVHIPHQSNLP